MPKLMDMCAALCAATEAPSKVDADINIFVDEKVKRFIGMPNVFFDLLLKDGIFKQIVLPKGEKLPDTPENRQLALKVYGGFVYSNMFGDILLKEREIYPNTRKDLANEYETRRLHKFFREGAESRPNKKKPRLH